MRNLNSISWLFLVLFIIFLGIISACSASNSNNNNNDLNNSEEAESEEDFPEKDIEMVIPHGPGGASDLIFRLVASKAEEELGQTIVPVNIDGASGTAAAREVKDAEPDGYTIFGAHNGIEMAYHAGISDFTLAEAFDPIAHITSTPNILTSNTNSGWKDAEDFADYIENNPGELKWGHVPGSTDHFFISEFMDAVDGDLDDVNLVPYEGSGDLINDLLAEDIDGTMNNIADSKDYYGEEFVALGLAHDERLEEASDIPTLKEQGIDMTNATTRGFLAPEGTSEDKIVILQDAFKKALEDPEVQEQINEEFGTIEDYKAHDEYEKDLKELTEKLNELSKDMDF